MIVSDNKGKTVATVFRYKGWVYMLCPNHVAMSRGVHGMMIIGKYK